MKREVFLIGIMSLALAGCGGSAAPTNSAANANTATMSTVPSTEFTDAGVALSEGKRLMDENQTDAAIAALKRAVELDPDLAEAYFHLGVAYDLLELQKEQNGTVQNPVPPASSNSKNSAPTQSESEKAFGQAVKAYKKWLAANPKDDTAHYYLGRTYAKLMKDEEAEESFQEAVKLKPEDTEYQTELGAILIKLAQYHEAIKPLKKAIELDSANGRAIDLLEEAEAGRRRVDYVSADKNSNTAQAKNANANANSASNTNSAIPSGDTKPAGNSAPKKPDQDPKGKKGESKEAPRPRTVPTRPNG